MINLVSSLADRFTADRTSNNTIFLRWFGALQWIIYGTAQTPLCDFPITMRAVRDICRASDWHGDLAMPDALIKEIRRLTDICITTIRRPTPPPSPSSSIWSDASFTAMAAFNDKTLRAVRQLTPDHFFRSTITTSAGTRPFISVPIVAAELWAGYIGFQHLDRADVWVCDNMPAVQAMVRGHSGSAICDAILRLWINSGRYPKFVRWVDTNCMLADPLSRPDQAFTAARPCGAPHLTHPLFRTRWRKGGEEEGAAV
jgi:hypothetical protein